MTSTTTESFVTSEPAPTSSHHNRQWLMRMPHLCIVIHLPHCDIEQKVCLYFIILIDVVIVIVVVPRLYLLYYQLKCKVRIKQCETDPACQAR